MIRTFVTSLALLAVLDGSLAQARDGAAVRLESVRAHERFLASDALQGRGSATRDEAIAAAYVASEFESYGLQPAPGMQGYQQRAEIVQTHLEGPIALTVDGAAIPASLLLGSGNAVGGKLAVVHGADAVASAVQPPVVLLDAPFAAATQALRKGGGERLILIRESPETRAFFGRLGNRPRLPTYFNGQQPPPQPSLVTVPSALFDRLARQEGAQVRLTLPGLVQETHTTTNAIGYLPGTDPKAGTILLSAHLDHLGLRPDGVMMPGANDDGSGTTAVLELAQALASGRKLRRSVLFVAYGSEEIGGFGSRWFGAHPPVPLSQIVANIEFEMIGAQDPKLPAGRMMMTGFDRSSLGAALARHGALLTGDPYPEEHFFERSDNYSLAVKGVVAHTISGWAVVPTYHQPTDSFANLDLAFMTRAIRSLVRPVRWLANGSFTPAWNAGGRPSR